MKNQEIFDLYEGLCELSQDEDLKINIVTSFRLAKNKKIIQPFYESIYETRVKLFEKYGEPTENGGWFVPKDRVDKFKAEFDALMNTETFINVEKIPISSFNEEGKVNIEIMEKLIPLIEIN